MAQTQRRPVPLTDSGELDTALAFLDFSRDCVLKKTDGLDEEQLRRVLVPTGTNLLGLVQHLAGAERYWFGLHLTGSTPPEGSTLEMNVPRARTAEAVIGDYRAAIAESNTAII